MDDIRINVAHPTVPVANTLTKEDVWGQVDENHKRVTDGMVVALSEQPCPIFGDILPYKSVTVVCQTEQVNDVIYWLEYVHGGGSINKTLTLDDGRVAIRSDYMCW